MNAVTLWKKMGVTLLGVAFIFTGTGYYAYQNEEMTTLNTLYPMKRFSEKVVVAFLRAPEAKSEFYANMAERRLKEVKVLLEMKKKKEKLLESFLFIEKAYASSDVDDELEAALLATLDDLAVFTELSLEEIEEIKEPTKAKEAIEKTSKKQEEHIRAIDSLKNAIREEDEGVARLLEAGSDRLEENLTKAEEAKLQVDVALEQGLEEIHIDIETTQDAEGEHEDDLTRHGNHVSTETKRLVTEKKLEVSSNKAAEFSKELSERGLADSKTLKMLNDISKEIESAKNTDSAEKVDSIYRTSMDLFREVKDVIADDRRVEEKTEKVLRRAREALEKADQVEPWMLSDLSRAEDALKRRDYVKATLFANELIAKLEAKDITEEKKVPPVVVTEVKQSEEIVEDIPAPKEVVDPVPVEEALREEVVEDASSDAEPAPEEAPSPVEDVSEETGEAPEEIEPAEETMEEEAAEAESGTEESQPADDATGGPEETQPEDTQPSEETSEETAPLEETTVSEETVSSEETTSSEEGTIEETVPAEETQPAA